jgi:hypothetical protein
MKPAGATPSAFAGVGGGTTNAVARTAIKATMRLTMSGRTRIGEGAMNMGK